jgi:uncharacterized protein YecE (DUF72 family)
MPRRRLRIGCSGWAYRDWRGLLYPEDLPQRRWLEHYAKTFDTVEVNNTFYRLPSRDAVAAWDASTPASFTFAVKVSRYLTHVKRLREAGERFPTLLERLEPLVEAGKLGPVLWQLPENFHRDDERLQTALEELPPGKHCFEFRHPSWFCDDVMGLLREHRAALVIGDHPDRPFQAREVTTDWTIVRFHRGKRGRGGSYSPGELEQWSRRFAQWRRRATVFAYFNHENSPHAIRDAMRLSGES